MSLPKDPALYEPQRRAFIAALQRGDITLEFPGLTETANFRFRLYMARKLDREQTEKMGGPRASQFDEIVIQIIRDAAGKPEPKIRLVHQSHVPLGFTARGKDGELIEI